MASYDFNQVSVMGRLGRDPEGSITQGGTQLCKFSIGCNTGEEASWFDCVAFGKTAELILKYFAKGKPIIVNGSLRQSKWEDKNTGEKRSRYEINVEKFHFLPSEGRGQAKSQTDSNPGYADQDDDIPF